MTHVTFTITASTPVQRCCRLPALTDGDVISNDSLEGLAIDGVPCNMHNCIVLDVGVLANLNAVHISCDMQAGSRVSY